MKLYNTIKFSFVTTSHFPPMFFNFSMHFGAASLIRRTKFEPLKFCVFILPPSENTQVSSSLLSLVQNRELSLMMNFVTSQTLSYHASVSGMPTLISCEYFFPHFSVFFCGSLLGSHLLSFLNLLKLTCFFLRVAVILDGILV